MNLLEELISGTIPSHEVHACLCMELYGNMFYMDDLIYEGFHASRVIFKQTARNGSIVVYKKNASDFIGVVAMEHFKNKVVFNIVDCRITIEIPR